MSIKLLALDMDGTVLNNDHVNISEKTKEAIKRADKFGVIVIPATGRSRINIPKSFEELLNIKYIISSNGADIFDCTLGKSIYNNFLDCDSVQNVMDILEQNNISCEIYMNGKAFSDANISSHSVNFDTQYNERRKLLKFVESVDNFRTFINDNKAHIEKINIPSLPFSLYDSIFDKLLYLSDTALTTSMGRNIEVNAKNCNKGSGLEFLCNYIGISYENVMAVGDSGNDLEMLSFAGVSVAMENSMDKRIIDVSRFLVGTNENGGVAEAIQKYIFKD